jgi:uncharacterized protein (TIGR02217 family)
VDEECAVVGLTATTFQLYKAYTDGGETYLRRILKPRAGSVLYSSTGDYTIDTTTGIITVVSGDDPVVSEFVFDVPVWFALDELPGEIVTRQPGLTGELLVQLGSVQLHERTVL